MSPGAELPRSAEEVDEKQEDLSSAVQNACVAVQEKENVVVEGVTNSVVDIGTTQEDGGSSDSETKKTNGKEIVEALTTVEDMDEELLQEQVQAVVEELQKRGACTTLALAKMLGMEKSTQLNPLLYLLLEKNVVVRVTDFPPIWSLSPTFPMSTLSPSAPATSVVHAPAPVPNPAIEPVSPASATPSSSPPAYTSVQLQPRRVVFQQPQAVKRHPAAGTVITFPLIPEERTTKPIITFPPIPSDPQLPSESASQPASSGTLQHQQQGADYWRSQMSGGKTNRNGGGGPPYKKWKKQKNLTITGAPFERAQGEGSHPNTGTSKDCGLGDMPRCESFNL